MSLFQQTDFNASCACAWCGETTVVEVDPSAGPVQRYVEDCQVCCRPNILIVRFAPDGTAAIETLPE